MIALLRHAMLPVRIWYLRNLLAAMERMNGQGTDDYLLWSLQLVALERQAGVRS